MKKGIARQKKLKAEVVLTKRLMLSMAASPMSMTWEGAAKISNLFRRMLTTKLIRMSGTGERKLWILGDHQNMTVSMMVG